jgi:DNA-binding NarL/FixJ family response regulator
MSPSCRTRTRPPGRRPQPDRPPEGRRRRTRPPRTTAASGPTAGPARPADAFPQFTAREREILDLLAAGRSNAPIAGAPFLSPTTVRNTLSNVLAELPVADRAGAIVRAREAGLGQ